MACLSIVSCFTKNYAYAIRSQLAQIQKNLAVFSPCEKTYYIYVTDVPHPDLEAFGKELMPDVEFINVIGDFKEHTNYKADAQKTIARMMAAGFNKATSLRIDFVWVVESDILPQPNNLRSLWGALHFDDYYSISFSPYVSQGMGGLLGGYGTLRNQILPDVFEDEREIPEELAAKVKEHKEKLEPGKQPAKEWVEEMQRLEGEIKNCKPKGNVFELQSKTFRRRGWGNHAMPQSSKGMIWEVDWIGTGNVLMDRKALHSADFIGYERAGGTQDLFLCYWKWKPLGLKIACVPHSPCHHVVRQPFKEGETVVSPYTVIVTYHEEEGEAKGHIRHKFEPFFDFVQ